MTERTQINHFIPCDCTEGGVIIRGIEIDYEPPVPLVFFLIAHAGDRAPSFWERIQYAFKFLGKGRVYTEEFILNGPGVVAMRDACQDALDRWPNEFRKLEDATLDEIYQAMKDEEAGREIRLEGNCSHDVEDYYREEE